MEKEQYFIEKKLKKWVGQITLGVNSDGKQIRKTFYGDTRKEVKEKLDLLQREKTNRERCWQYFINSRYS